MIEESIKNILLEIESDAALDGNGELREGLKSTPKRVVESWKELYSGYSQDPEQTLNATFNGEGYDGIVLLKDIEFHSTCEHHMLSFTGKAHVAYIPTDRIVGILPAEISVKLESHLRSVMHALVSVDAPLGEAGTHPTSPASGFAQIQGLSSGSGMPGMVPPGRQYKYQNAVRKPSARLARDPK